MHFPFRRFPSDGIQNEDDVIFLLFLILSSGYQPKQIGGLGSRSKK